MRQTGRVLRSMRCQDCETVWYSDGAERVVEDPDCRCTRCGGALTLDAPLRLDSYETLYGEAPTLIGSAP